ncbi:MAG TPA: formate dehydrogenase subunit alpha [Thermoanaerobaculia bacterium]|nr:formate dehydrogenase subunit alpha [Thermoanaerobaculia bacterium]
MTRPAPALLDGRPVEVHPGETVLAAARRLGIEIPTLCHGEGLTPEGGCRMCLVEDRGVLKAACHTRLEPGMEVRTGGERLTRLRRGVLSLIVADHEPDRFRARPDGNEVERWMAELGLDEGHFGHRPHPRTAGALDASHPYLRFDPSLCIVCRRCLAACEEEQGQFVYGIEGRGGDVRLVFGPEEAFAASDCTACGACVVRCPTGAISDRDRRDAAEAVAWTDSVCGYCGVGCRVRIGTGNGAAPDGGGRRRVLRIDGVPDAAVNRGHLCAKGRYAHAYHRSPERLTRPLLREGDSFREVSWDEAVAFAARRLVEIRDRQGSDALAVMTSSRSTNEAAYLFQKLFRVVLGSNHVDCCARVCHSSTALALQIATGTGAASASYTDLDRARAVVVAGANPTEAHPVVGARIKQAVLGGARLLVIDPRRIELAEYAELHLALRPGTNVALFNALAKLLVEDGGYDAAYAEERLEGFEELRGFLASLSVARAAEVTGVPEESIRRAAAFLAEAGPTLFVTGLGLSELTQGTASVLALINLGMLTGSIGRPGAGMLPLRGQNNVQGNADMGSMPNQVTGYQPLDDPEVRARLAEVWGTVPPVDPGLTVTEMTEAAREGRIRGLWIQGEDIAQSDPSQERVIEALEGLDLLVVQELFMTETARRAHLVLPAAGALEQDGTFTNGERRIQRVRRAVEPPGEARPDWEVAAAVARSILGDGPEGAAAGWDYPSPAEVMDEVARAAPRLFGGVSYDRLGGDGLQWPCPAPGHPGTATVHGEAFLRGKGLLVAVDWEPSPEHGAEGFPFLLVTGRVLQHYNVGTMTRRTPHRELVPEDVLEIHPEDATRLGVADGARVALESRWGRTEAPARHSRRVQPGTLFHSFHFPETHTNRLVGPHRDPRSKCPDYKVIAVRLGAAAGPGR